MKAFVPYIILSIVSVIIDALNFFLISYINIVEKYYRLVGQVNPHNLAVLVTGADTSLGMAITHKLGRLGFTVYAAVKVLDDDLALRLKQSNSHIHPIECDVIKYREVKKAANHLRQELKLKKLWSVISADSFYPSHSPWLLQNSIHAHTEWLRVTALGSARLTKELLPLLQQCPQSRIIYVIGMPGGMELPANISYTIARASETQFIHVIRNQLRKDNITASLFDCSKGVDRKSVSSMKTESLLASPAASEPSSPEIILTEDGDSMSPFSYRRLSASNIHTLHNKLSSNSCSVSSSSDRKSSCDFVITDECKRKADKLCKIVSSPEEPPAFI